jgi:uncharacterized protein (UPF0264 family)
LAGLLVSVRSADEARLAASAGATVIDVKEPRHGPLGCASTEVWRSVREAVPRSIPVSVALGELADWVGRPQPEDWAGLSYRKFGLARAGIDWAERWAAIRDEHRAGPPWVVCVYADWKAAKAPSPDAILDVALAVSDCVGVLVDTWDKSHASALDDSWLPFVARAKAAGRMIVLAGRLDAEAIRRLVTLGPDLYAVRGAACQGGDRLASIEPDRVRELVRLTSALPSGPGLCSR